MIDKPIKFRMNKGRNRLSACKKQFSYDQWSQVTWGSVSTWMWSTSCQANQVLLSALVLSTGACSRWLRWIGISQLPFTLGVWLCLESNQHYY